MPLQGGPADKAGNRYENWWTLLQVVRMLHGTFDSIRLEPPGVDKAEFLVTAGSVLREWHQVKRSHPTGKWTMAALSAPDMKLLQAMGEFLSDSQSRFVFASSSDARELAELSERAEEPATPKSSSRPFWLLENI